MRRVGWYVWMDDERINQQSDELLLLTHVMCALAEDQSKHGA